MRAGMLHMLFSRYVLTVLLVLLSCKAFAQSADFASLQGVYKNKFIGQYISGEKYESEDVLELVTLTPSETYVRIHLEFDNGHTCDLWGVAEKNGESLLYRGRLSYGERPCELSLQNDGQAITLEDRDGICRASSCGSRGAYSGAGFDIRKRRAIKYMDRLISSWQYKAALEEYQESKRQRP